MSVEATRSVWRFSEAEGTTRLVLLAIADNADDGGLAWPGHESIAEKSRMSRRAVIENIRLLETMDEVFVLHRRNLGNVYLIRLGDLPALHETAHRSKKFTCRFCTNMPQANVQPGVYLSADSRMDKCRTAYTNVKTAAHEGFRTTKETSKNRRALSREETSKANDETPRCHYCKLPMIDDGSTLTCSDPSCGYVEVVKAS